MSVAVTHRLFTVDEYYEMARVGILAEDERVELLAGEIIKIGRLSSRQAACVRRLNKVL
jgi:hypothetical protein